MHHKPVFKCGYDQNAVCTGIQLLPALESLSCQLPNDFYHLPTKFQSVVQRVQFYDFGSNAFGDSDFCVTEYDPLGQGLFDAYGKLGGKGVSSVVKCYKDDPEQRPGILLPLPELSAFSPAMLQAIPTTAVVGTLTDPGTVNMISAPLNSGCSGFTITARYASSKVRVAIDTGQFLAYTDEDGDPVSVQVKTNTTWIVNRGDADQIQLWLIAQQNLVTHKWTGVVACTLDGGKTWTPDNVPTKHIKKRLLGTVSYKNRKPDVVQVLCSPVDLRDGTDVQLKGNNSKYVFIFDTQSGTRKWVPLNQCG